MGGPGAVVWEPVGRPGPAWLAAVADRAVGSADGAGVAAVRAGRAAEDAVKDPGHISISSSASAAARASASRSARDTS